MPPYPHPHPHLRLAMAGRAAAVGWLRGRGVTRMAAAMAWRGKGRRMVERAIPCHPLHPPPTLPTRPTLTMLLHW